MAGNKNFGQLSFAELSLKMKKTLLDFRTNSFFCSFSSAKMSLFLVILIGMAFGSVATMECPAGCQQCRIEAVICERMDLQNFVPSGPEDRIYADIISFRESRNLATDLIECAILIQVSIIL